MGEIKLNRLHDHYNMTIAWISQEVAIHTCSKLTYVQRHSTQIIGEGYRLRAGAMM